MPMPLTLTREAEEFASRTQPFLEERPERNILATVLHAVRKSGGYGSEPPRYAYLTTRQDEIVAVALRTPPYPMLAAGLGDPADAEELIARWYAEDTQVPGVSAEPDTARAICAAWTSHTGAATYLEFSEAMHELQEVIWPAAPAPGELRLVTEADRELLRRWLTDFHVETGLGNGAAVPRAIDRGIAHEQLHVWEDGRPRCVVGTNPTVAGIARIGPVYTPPEHRAHGYATIATATVSQLLLARGAERCALFTDLANPTSNKIYAAIGYRRFGDWEQHGFDLPR